MWVGVENVLRYDLATHELVFAAYVEAFWVISHYLQWLCSILANRCVDKTSDLRLIYLVSSCIIMSYARSYTPSFWTINSIVNMTHVVRRGNVISAYYKCQFLSVSRLLNGSSRQSCSLIVLFYDKSMIQATYYANLNIASNLPSQIVLLPSIIVKAIDLSFLSSFIIIDLIKRGQKISQCF